MALTASVAPGAQYTFTYNATAPSTPGTYNFQWKMLRDAAGWFGAASTNAAVSVTASANLPTLSVKRTPTPLVAGQNHTLTWSSTKATSVTYTCTASGTGFTGSATLAASGTTTAATSAAWVGYPSTCTWKATGAGGSTTQTETMTTVAAPVVDSVTYFHNDIAGTPQLATNASGALVWKENYLPYGQRQVQAPASAGNKLWYTGKPHKEDTGLTYMGARYYMPLVGRFTGIDPVDIVPGQPHSLNRYAYGNNNPYKYVDPDGRSPIDVGFLVFDAVKLGLALYSGVGVGPAAVDVGISALSLLSPVPGAGQAFKGVRAAEHVAEAANTAVAATGGRLGSQITRQHIDDVATVMEQRGWTITHGGGPSRGLKEEFLPGPGGGLKGSSYPDITAAKNGRTLRVNTVDTRADGVTPTTREATNAARIRQQTGEHLLLIPKP